jgi:hypothetical protein
MKTSSGHASLLSNRHNCHQHSNFGSTQSIIS